MSRSTASASGIVYAVLSVIGILLLVILESNAKTDEQILSHYADGGNRAAEMTGAALYALGAGCFVWFVSALRARLRSVESQSEPYSGLVHGAGVAAAAVMIAAAAVIGGVSFTLEFDDRFTVDPGTARLTVMTGYTLVAGVLIAKLFVVAATSVAALRTDAFPNWVAWVGGAAIVLGIAEAFLLPVFVMPAWAVVMSIVMMRSSADTGPRSRANLTAPIDEPVPTG